MSRRFLAMVMALPLAAFAGVPAASADEARSPMAKGAQVYQVDLDALNDSGVEGKAVLVQRDGKVKVKIHARGLVPGMLHVQHIHGLAGSTNATCPPPSASGDDDIISLGEGLPFYGPIIQPLTPFPMASKGKVNYHQTFTVDGDLADLTDEAIVLHGGFVDGEYVATLPVACGEIS